MYTHINTNLFVTDSVLLHRLGSVQQMSDTHREDGGSKEGDGNVVNGAGDIKISVKSPKKKVNSNIIQ